MGGSDSRIHDIKQRVDQLEVGLISRAWGLGVSSSSARDAGDPEPLSTDSTVLRISARQLLVQGFVSNLVCDAGVRADWHLLGPEVASATTTAVGSIPRSSSPQKVARSRVGRFEVSMNALAQSARQDAINCMGAHLP